MTLNAQHLEFAQNMLTAISIISCENILHQKSFSSLLTQNDKNDRLCFQLNSKLGSLTAFPDLQLVSNSNIKENWPAHSQPYRCSIQQIQKTNKTSPSTDSTNQFKNSP